MEIRALCLENRKQFFCKNGKFKIHITSVYTRYTLVYLVYLDIKYSRLLVRVASQVDQQLKLGFQNFLSYLILLDFLTFVQMRCVARFVPLVQFNKREKHP